MWIAPHASIVATILKFDIAPQCYVGGLKELLITFQVLPTQTLYTAEAVLEWVNENVNTIPKSTSISLYLNWLMIIKTIADYTRQSTSMYI